MGKRQKEGQKDKDEDPIGQLAVENGHFGAKTPLPGAELRLITRRVV